MNEIRVSKLNNKISMWDLFLIYQSLTNEFLIEYNNKKKRIELMDDDLIDLVDIVVECTPSGQVKTSYKFKEIVLEKVKKNEKIRKDLKKVLKHIDLLSSDIYNNIKYDSEYDEKDYAINKAVEDLASYCSSFIAGLHRDISFVSKSNTDLYKLDFNHIDAFCTIDDMLLISYTCVQNWCRETSNILRTSKEGAIISGESRINDKPNDNRLREYWVEYKISELPISVQNYIKRNKTNEKRFSYSINLDGKGIVELKPLLEPQNEQKQISEISKKQPLPIKGESGKENMQTHKDYILWQLSNLDKSDDNNGGKTNGAPIIIPDYIFFSSITEDKKKIDPFFREHKGVLPYCNLSFVDFSKADVRYFDFSENPEANIILNKVYNLDVTGTNFENNQNLSGQSLEGINATAANFIGTNVAVPLESAIVKGAVFDQFCLFTKNGLVIDAEEAKCGGILIEEKVPELRIDTRKHAIRQQNNLYKEENNLEENNTPLTR